MLKTLFCSVIATLIVSQGLGQLYQRSSECDVYPFRINLPAINNFIYSWNCICLEGKNKVSVSYSGARSMGNPTNVTTTKEVQDKFDCFSQGYLFNNFKEKCTRDPTAYAIIATPVIADCVSRFVKKSSKPTTTTYTREYCASEFSQLRDVNLQGVVIGIWFCHCSQLQWKALGVTTPTVSDGRSAFVIPTAERFPVERPDALDYMESCVIGQKFKMDAACHMRNYDYNHFRNASRLIWTECCNSANTFMNAGLDCEEILANELA